VAENIIKPIQIFCKTINSIKSYKISSAHFTGQLYSVKNLTGKFKKHLFYIESILICIVMDELTRAIQDEIP